MMAFCKHNESVGEKKLEIDQHLTKLWATV